MLALMIFSLFYFDVIVSSQILSGREDAVPTIPKSNIARHHRLVASSYDDREKPSAKDAIIKLFPPPIFSYQSMMTLACNGATSSTVKLAPEVCLSGEYYLKNNLLIVELPVCLDGTIPATIFYENTGCVGKPKFSLDHYPQESAKTCLSNDYASKSWSLIFRCGTNPTKAQGAYHHQTAIPPKRYYVPDKTADGIVVSYIFPSCAAHSSDPQIQVAVDHCFTTPGYGLRITTPAICANGTRAKWARFEDLKCNNGVLSKRYGLKDILDSDIGLCFSVEENMNKDRRGSYAFWCDGIHTEARSTSPYDEMSEAAFEFLLPHQRDLSNTNSSTRRVMQVTGLQVWVWIGLMVTLLFLFLFRAMKKRVKKIPGQRYGPFHLQ